jgi:L-aspartate oxidase
LHPNNDGRFFLISEALRGEGAVLKNREREAFMQGVHPLMDLAPRDIVSRAIVAEMMKKNLHHVYLDITSRSRSYLRQRFPTIYGECMRRGIDIAINWIPVIPVQHYFMGGVKVDLNARTTVDGLYACGETARTGVHGANRLASNSLLECLVFGRRCAQDICGAIRPKAGHAVRRAEKAGPEEQAHDLDSFTTEIREVMTRKCGILRDEKGLAEAASRIGELKGRLDEVAFSDRKAIETYNIATVAASIIEAALVRTHSVGAHFRSDKR